MTTTEVDTPLIDEGIHAINFFNGRLLTAKDMTREQKARQDADSYLGKALGDGIACGLNVTESASSTPTSPVLHVSEGLAINRAGQTLNLGSGVDVKLNRPTTTTASSQVVGFARCVALLGGTYVADPGIYLLTIASACATKGSAPVNGLDPASARCNRDVIVETVQFRLLALHSKFTAAELADETHLQNHVAYRCFAADEFAAYSANPFGGSFPSSLLEDFRPTPLTAYDVPLALIHVTLTRGIRFIDMWSVRRRSARKLAEEDWTPLIGDERLALAEAIFMQFQDQIASIQRQGSAAMKTLSAADRFEYLPPAGYLPAGSNAFQWSKFLGLHAPAGIIPLNHPELGRAILDHSLGRGPVKILAKAESEKPVPFHVYSLMPQKNIVLFSRSSLPEVIARDVYFDNTICQLPEVYTVQDAIEHLCRHTHGCCSIVASPGSGWEKELAALAPNQDVNICFGPGAYSLANPIRLSGLGHVKLCGAGQATRLCAMGSEFAIRFDKCRSVFVEDLYGESGVAAATPEEVHNLNGTLAIIDCGEVSVESVWLRCASKLGRAAACITVRNTSSSGNTASLTSARVCRSQLLTGNDQVGVLIVNCARVNIEDCCIRLASSASLKSLLSRSDYSDMLRRQIFSADKVTAPNLKAKPTVSYNRVRVAFLTVPALEKVWQNAINYLKPTGIDTAADLTAYLRHLANDAITNSRAFYNLSSQLRSAFSAAIPKEGQAALMQGIVIGGALAHEVRIRNNSVYNAVQGIHIGLSHRNADPAAPDIAGTALVDGNSIHIVLNAAELRERHGIFLGNCSSVVVENNRISITRINNASQKIEGIRAYGQFGERMIIRANHIDGASAGMHFNPLLIPEKKRWQWIITENMAVGAESVYIIPEKARAAVQGYSNNYA